jgi:hypothetical protein
MQWEPSGIRTALSARYVSCTNSADDRNAATSLPIVCSSPKTVKHSVPSVMESWLDTRYIYATFYTAHHFPRSLDLLLQALLLMSVRPGTVALILSHSIYRYTQAGASHFSPPRRQSGLEIGSCMLHCSQLRISCGAGYSAVLFIYRHLSTICAWSPGFQPFTKSAWIPS